LLTQSGINLWRRWNSWLMLLIALTACSIPPDVDEQIRNANNYFQQADYPQVIQILETLVATDLQSGDVFFNLGNVQYVSGHIGQALLNYRRAQRFMPRDEETKLHIIRIRAQRLDGPLVNTYFSDRIVQWLNETLTYQEFVLLAWLLWVLLWILCLFYVVRRSRRLKLYIVICGIGFLCVVFIGVLWWQFETVRPAAILTADAASVMSGPGKDYMYLYDIHEAIEMRIIDQQNGYVRFQLTDGREGWCEEVLIEYVDQNLQA